MKVKIDKIIKSKRKSVALEINDQAQLIVRLPFRFSENRLELLLADKISWIKKKQAEMRKKIKFTKRNFVKGEKFLYLGQEYELRIATSSAPLELKDYFYLSQRYEKSAQAVFRYWYKDMALEKIRERALYYANKYDFTVNKIKLSSARKRWGSCSSQANVNFSWRLIMAPLFVIDYVIVHELVHLKHMDHSSRFWNRVSEIFPNYLEAKKWLIENGQLLNF